jgi:type IV pilus assembly protein PilE
MRKFGANGFTLMEVMITVVIVAILAGIAYPSYTRFVAETRRSEATIALTQLAAQQEKYFTACGGYAGGIGVGPGRVCPPAVGSPAGTIDTATVSINAGGITREGRYQITITAIPAPPGRTLADSYNLTAVPLGTQALNDALKCTTIVLNSTGIKSATGTESLTDPNGGKCWKK